MIYVAIIAVSAACIYLARFYGLKREIRRAARQLGRLHRNEMEKKLDLTMYDRDFEQLAVEVNRQIDATKQAIAEKRRTENELKQAISNISHDIRTPMTSILGYVQLLESGELTPDKRSEYVAVVKGGALRLKVLLEEFFELSIIESADFPLKPEPIRLNHLVPEVLAGFYEEFHQRNLEPILHIPEEDIRIHADVSAVKRVLENLLLNAIRHAGGPVAIRLTKSPSDAQLVISNPAPQLREEDLVLLFDRFYKGDKTRSGKGAGLGLAIARSLMTRMRGTLTAELRDGQLHMRCGWKS